MSNKNDAFAGLVSFGGSTSSSSATQNMSLEEQRRRNLNNSRSNTLNSTPSSFSTAPLSTPSYHTANPTLPSQQFNLPSNRAQSLSPSGVGTGSPLLPMHTQPRANYTAASSMSPAFSTASNIVKPTSHSPSKDPFADLLGTSPLASVQLPLNAINSTQSSGFNTPITMNQYNRSTSSSSTPIMAPQTLNGAFAIQSGFHSAFQSPQNGLVNGFMPQQQQQQQLPLSLLQQQQQQQQNKQSVYQQPQTQEVNNNIWNFDALASATQGASASKTSNLTSADPFGLGFNDSSNTQTNPTPLPTEVGSFQQAEDDDPFGILTGKPTFKPIQPKNVLDTPLQSAPQSPPQPLSLHASPISRASAAASSNGSPSITRKQRQHDEHIARILDMGFDIPSATSALEASGGDVHEAINLLIANREALEGQQSRSSAHQNERQQYPMQSSRASSRDYERRTRQAEDNFASNPPTAAALFSNAKSIFDMGRAKLTEVYEKASEKVAAVIAENVDGNKQQAQNNPTSWDQDYDRNSSQRNRYRDDSSSDEDEVALDRKSRSSHRANPSTNGGLEAASPRGKSPRTSALRLNSREPSESGRLKQVSFGMDPNAQSNLFESHKSSPVFVPAAIAVPQPVHTASPAQKAAANSFRERGNESFKKGQFADAEAHYTTALSHMPAEDWDTIALLNNRAAARLKTGDYTGCVQDCNAVQALQPKDVKSLLRRAAAWEGREKWDEATKDYETLMVLEPSKAVSLGLARARKGAAVHSGGDAAFVANENASVSTKSAIDDLAFLSGNVADTGSFNSFNRASSSTVSSKPMAASVKKAVDKAVETLRQQNEDQEREEEEKFQAKEGIEAKIDAWKQGKEANIRALLSSLDSVLWSDLNWNTINLSELITPQQVKIKYMKAVAKVHPDKLKQGTTVEQKLIANEVFGALNKAWDAFKVQSGL
ncbi:hypothetical protein CcCBS67573_g00977 [Chytriomyces confervae]|uniref:UBA domain-containing protein n=1 Tax=Chytriomyces confervae TaxID=246404 RepID=A0A507FMT8_9FUNG|nr:hypothetical protein CcCBS67573_g00977 [Chytriomyces confervae]